MDLGFETVGNATLVCYDRRPVLATDPWLVGPAYFGSWTLSHPVPEAQADAIARCEFVWLSHGHPDHLSPASLDRVRGATLLLPDHHGARIRRDLEAAGFRVRVMRDRTWLPLSPRIRALSIADYNQDAVLLVDLGGVLLVDTNDAVDHGWARFVRSEVRRARVAFLLALSGYGDADMINFYDEDGRHRPPVEALGVAPGGAIARKTEFFGTRFFVPFSSMHHYQRADSVWANAFATPLEDYAKGFDARGAEILPAFLRYDAIRDRAEPIRPEPAPPAVVDPAAFGDDWSVPLEREDAVRLRDYMRTVGHLERALDFVTFRVGGRDTRIEFGGRRTGRGITFEAPRTSLVAAVAWEVFDDLLIGNFMRTTLHGPWGKDRLYPDFTPYVAKYGDNGRARSPQELRGYFDAYRRRAPLDFLRHRLMRHAMRAADLPTTLVRRYVRHDSAAYRLAKRGYWTAVRLAGIGTRV